jgi:hypothetical protein
MCSRIRIAVAGKFIETQLDIYWVAELGTAYTKWCFYHSFLFLSLPFLTSSVVFFFLFINTLFYLSPGHAVYRFFTTLHLLERFDGRGRQTNGQTLVKVKVKVTLRLTVSQSVSLGVEPHLGLMTRYLLLFDSYGLVFVRRPLWREDGSVFVICCWPSPAQSFSGPSPLGVATIFYSLRFETSLFVVSYDSQGHGGGIRPHLHTGQTDKRTIWRTFGYYILTNCLKAE